MLARAPKGRFEDVKDQKMVAAASAAMFLTGIGRDHRGRSLAEVLAFDDSALEQHHDYIQWLFPLPEASRINMSAPILSREDIATIRLDSEVRTNLLNASNRMLAFYRENDHWLVPFNHNHLRITRIIRCLALCVGEEEANGFYTDILALVEAAGRPVNEDSLRYWRQAAHSSA